MRIVGEKYSTSQILEEEPQEMLLVFTVGTVALEIKENANTTEKSKLGILRINITITNLSIFLLYWFNIFLFSK